MAFSHRVFLVTLFTQIAPTRAEVSMTFNGYELRYKQGTLNISEDFGPQFIDIVDVIITSQNGERSQLISLCYAQRDSRKP